VRTSTDDATPQEPGAAADPTAAETLSPSQRLWNEAFDSLEKDDSTRDIVRAYSTTLTSVLDAKTSTGSDISAEWIDPYERQRHMRRLVREGQARIATAAKVTKITGDVAKFVISAKAMIDLAIQNIPQAALPWAGVCIVLQVSRHLVRAMLLS
jgi:hypothetical protein